MLKKLTMLLCGVLSTQVWGTTQPEENSQPGTQDEFGTIGIRTSFRDHISQKPDYYGYRYEGTADFPLTLSASNTGLFIIVKCQLKDKYFEWPTTPTSDEFKEALKNSHTNQLQAMTQICEENSMLIESIVRKASQRREGAEWLGSAISLCLREIQHALNAQNFDEIFLSGTTFCFTDSAFNQQVYSNLVERPFGEGASVSQILQSLNLSSKEALNLKEFIIRLCFVVIREPSSMFPNRFSRTRI